MRKNPTHLLAWSRSAEFRAIARRQIRKLNAARAKAPRCSATAKSTGERCKQAAMPNGTCAFHGGRTPKGDAWHKPRWPNRNAPDAVAKANRKAADLEKRARKQAKRVAKRSPEDQAAYKRWQKTHAPTSAASRAAVRDELRHAREAWATCSSARRAPAEASPELRALRDAVIEAEGYVAFLDAGCSFAALQYGVFA